MAERAVIGRELVRRLGRIPGDRLNHMLANEQRAEQEGRREPGQPSPSLTEIERRLLRSPLEPDELRRIRLAVGIDVLEDLGVAPSSPNSGEVQ